MAGTEGRHPPHRDGPPVSHDVGRGLTVVESTVGAVAVLEPHGTLDGSTYRALRDQVIATALERRAVVVDVTDLDVPAESAWLAFSSAHSYVDRWPGVPVLLVCRTPSGRSAISRTGIDRRTPVFRSLQEALSNSAASGRRRDRVRARLAAEPTSPGRARDLVTTWLTEWSRPELIAPAKVVITALVENVLRHTVSCPEIRLETDGATVVVAVEDGDHLQAVLPETTCRCASPTGLKVVTAMSRAWGNAPTPTGKTVWAMLGPENRL